MRMNCSISRPSSFEIGAQVRLDEGLREQVEAGRDRRVRGEERARAGGLAGLEKREPVLVA